MAPQPSNIAKKRANLVKALSAGWSSNNSKSNSNTRKKRAANNKPLHAIWNQANRRNNVKKVKKERFSWV